MNGGFEGEQTYVNSPEEDRFQRDVERVYEIVLPTEGTRLHEVVRTDLFRGAVTEAEKAKAAAENGYDLRYLKSVGEEVSNKMKAIGLKSMDKQATSADKAKLARFNTLVYGKPNPSSDEVLFGLSWVEVGAAETISRQAKKVVAASICADQGREDLFKKSLEAKADDINIKGGQVERFARMIRTPEGMKKVDGVAQAVGGENKRRQYEFVTGVLAKSTP